MWYSFSFYYLKHTISQHGKPSASFSDSMKATVRSLSLGLLGLATLGRTSLLDTILTDLETAVDCDSCQTLLVPLQTLALLGDTTFDTTFATICKTLHVEDDDVCDGLLNTTGPILAHSLRRFTPGTRTADKFCSAMFGLCPQPSVAAFSVPFPKPAPANPKKFVSKGKAPFQVVHFSDVHIDREYTTGSEANCTKPICCRNFADDTAPAMIPAGPFGNRQCDAPSDLADTMFGAIKQVASSAKFSIFTGDVVAHDIWLVDRPEATEDLTAWNAQMAANVIAPVYPGLGNHDTAPVNSFPRSDIKTDMQVQWVFDIQSQGWLRWINASAANEVDHQSGSYSLVVPGTNLRLISLNTQYWYQDNFWLYDTNNMPSDPNGVLAFIVSQLQAAEDAGQRAWLYGHIPPGKSDFLHDQSNYFNQIVQRYKDTIAAQFYGHTHRDELEIAYSDFTNQTAATADSFGLICPSLTPTSGNPAFKVYDIDPDTYEVMDAKVFISNISDPSFQVKPTWDLYYSARDVYGPLVGNLGPTDSLNASFWHKLTEVFETNDNAFQLYVQHLSRGADATVCTGSCKTTTICDIRAMRSENNCDTVTPGFSVKRGEPTAILPGMSNDECEGNGAHTIIRKIVAEARANGIRDEHKEIIRRSIGPLEA
ncbi:hypothetical protein M422DRAFT_34142 [Sphaerobolus stellatus SS14]|uniref:Sphingomyelin phosphodiesterase n=1 Tax=Sphaerobolus stellatus (strain SS14) TaxID=990650 RepID=A0A0C9VHH7_SPHS4|nr:hypothetical protein M422DRAFT_34142 [Sphaerobolus stellatus SS14]